LYAVYMLRLWKATWDRKLSRLLLGLALLAVACAPATSGDAPPAQATATAAVEPATVETATVPLATATTTPEPTATSLPDEDVPSALQRSFDTDFSQRTISFEEILSGGPPKDGIPAIDNPRFIGTDEADEWISDLEPVTVFEHDGDVRIYPFQILTWHEIVNDVVGGRPVTVTFCPLCNTAIVFDATVDGRELDFGTTGRLRYSNLLMYDRQTESWWQQATGEAVIGEFVGRQLEFLPAPIISWAEARETYPDAQVLSRDTGFSRSYGQNPYAGYDNVNSSPFLFSGPSTPEELPPMARVTTVELNGEAVAYPNEVLEEVRVANDTVGGVEVAVFWQEGLASALDSNAIAAGRDVGANAVFERTLDGQTLTFVDDEGTIKDEQTGSTWNVLGEATAGELAGEQLQPVVKVDHFWFSWAAFRPDTRIYQP
ncbi:MAG: DUF3179 domain-containing protein, partial [Chloroflexota bacterium]